MTIVVVVLLLAASDVDGRRRLYLASPNARKLRKKRSQEVSIMSTLILDMTILDLI